MLLFPDDDQFSKLKAVFLATGRGNRQDLPLVDVDNQLLMQLLLLKDEGSKTLDETASFFQQLLKPDLVKTVLLSRHGHGGCQQRCQQVQEESDPGDVDSEPED